MKAGYDVHDVFVFWGQSRRKIGMSRLP